MVFSNYLYGASDSYKCLLKAFPSSASLQRLELTLILKSRQFIYSQHCL
ncbi:protein of unknown function [Candidatus Methylacidiphilum fumarolicum]|uniref:Uncharacterized protein n=1 Tax=Candidatus Methylacidiphilum fumarolicum TaxID=591154 RepID=A0ABN8XBR2_9BACT|nr:protein of unknown function [Candidatus Methylacidiphilum fumarolicum]